MERKTRIILGFCVLAALFVCGPALIPHKKKQRSVAQETRNRTGFRDQGKQLHQNIEREALAATQKLNHLPKEKTVTHTIREFAAGQFDNAIVTENGLEVGDKPGPAMFQTAYPLFGTYQSREEEIGGTFDLLYANYEVDCPNESKVILEIRIKSLDGTWSAWRQITAVQINQPVKLDQLAVAWQYRLTLYAKEFAAKPKVHRVTIVAQNMTLAEVSPDPIDFKEPGQLQ